jgi:hypothetical protein
MKSVQCREAAQAAMFLLAMAIVGPGVGSIACAHEDNGRHGQSADMFYNYYAPPGYAGQSAALYVSPRPTPPLVGHTWYTYQPLLPHEFLYDHHRTYTRVNCGAGWTTTKVTWSHAGHFNPLYFPFNFHGDSPEYNPGSPSAQPH